VDLDEPGVETALRAAAEAFVAEGVSYTVIVSREPADDDGAEPARTRELDPEPVTGVRSAPGIAAAVCDVSGTGCAVVVREEPAAIISGVAYSSNPLTALDETVIEGLRGTPQSLDTDNVVLQRWVRRWGAWTEHPVASDIPTYVVLEVADTVAAMGARNGWPVAVDWTWDGEHVVYLGLTEIETVDGVRLFSRRLGRAVVPGVITPLLWDTHVRIAGGAWTRLFAEMLGDTGVEPEDLAHQFFHRAYVDLGSLGRVFRIAGLQREALELLVLGASAGGDDMPRVTLSARALSHAPRAAAFMAGKLRLRSMIERELARTRTALDGFLAGARVDDLTARQVWTRIAALEPLVGEAAYLDVLARLAYTVYAHRLSRHLMQAELELDDVELGGEDSGMEGRDPGPALRRLSEQWRALPPGTRNAVAGGKESRVKATKCGVRFLAEVDEFLAVYGHFSDADADLSVPRWRERRRDVLIMIANVEEPGGEKAGDAGRDLLVSRGASKAALREYDRLGTWRALRERVQSQYLLVSGELRPLYLRLGDVLTRRGWLDDAADVFLLEPEEVASALDYTSGGSGLRGIAERRRAEFDASRDVRVPDLVFGEDEPPVSATDAAILRGTPASPGHCAGPAVVIRDAGDVSRVSSGDVIVVIDPSVDWTAAAHAGHGVVTTFGGYATSDSRRSRALGLPAVAGLDRAAETIADGDMLTVDGYRGVVSVCAAQRCAASDTTAAGFAS